MSSLGYLLASAGLVVLVYVLARVAGVGWFRSRHEHVRRVMRELEGED